MNAAEAPSLSIDLAREAAFRLGALEVQPSTREVLIGDHREVMDPRVMQVLVALARRRGEVVSRNELIASCWGGRAVSDDAINRAIAGVRRFSEAFGGFTVETVTRVGYRLSVRESEDLPRARRLRVWWLGAGAFALALLVAAGLAFWPRERNVAPTAPVETRIAVLPFEASGPGTDAQAFADSLLDELIDSMAKSQIQPVSRTESLALRGPDARREIDRLGVDLMLDGAVRSNGKMLKVSAHLSDPRNQTTLWSMDFDAPIEKAGQLQTNVVGWATFVAANLLVPQVQRFRSKPSALAAYLGTGDLEYPRAITMLRQAIAIAPDFSAAHGALAVALIENAPPAPSAAREAIYAEAEQEVRREISTDPTYGDGYFIQAWAFTPPLAWAEQERLLRRAVDMLPIEPETHVGYGGFLRSTGRLEEALPHERQAVVLRPYFPLARAQLLMALITAGRADEAAEALSEDQRLTDSVAWTAADFYVALDKPIGPRTLRLLDDKAVQRWLGRPEAVQLWRTVVGALYSNDSARKASAARAIKVAAARGFAKWSEVEAPGPPDESYAIASLAALGDVDGAFAEAERLIRPRRMMVVGGGYKTVESADFDISILYHPLTAAMRRDRRFMALAAKLGLVDYWRTSGHWPDFCSEPGLPYDCKTEAARASKLAKL